MENHPELFSEKGVVAVNFDKKSAQILKAGLGDAGFPVASCNDAEQAIDEIRSKYPRFVLLKDGISAEMILDESGRQPIIAVTDGPPRSRGVQLLKNGASIVLNSTETTPDLVAAYLRSTLKRAERNHLQPMVYVAGDVYYDPNTGRLTKNGKRLNGESRMHEFLGFFGKEKVISMDDIIEWQNDNGYMGSPSGASSLLSGSRRLLGTANESTDISFIRKIAKRQYMLIAHPDG